MTKKKPTNDKPTAKRIAQIESDLKDHRHKNTDDLARVLREVAHQNQDLIKDKWISECIQQADSLYDMYLGAVRLLYLSKNKRLRKEKLLSHYDQNRQDYPLVFREMLEAEDLYKLTPKQESRDFKVKLISKMLEYWQPGMACNIEVLRSKVQKSR
jgi:hypothetical protein